MQTVIKAGDKKEVQLLDFDRLPENMRATIKTKYVVLYQPQEETSEK